VNPTLESIIKDAILAIVVAIAVVVTVDLLRVLLVPNEPPSASTDGSGPNPPEPSQ
jgi:hypothetical protein